MTAERIVVRGYAPRAWYAADADLCAVTSDRAKAHRFASAPDAAAAIARAADRGAGYDPALAGYWHVERPTIADEARAYVDPTAR